MIQLLKGEIIKEKINEEMEDNIKIINDLNKIRSNKIKVFTNGNPQNTNVDSKNMKCSSGHIMH